MLRDYHHTIVLEIEAGEDKLNKIVLDFISFYARNPNVFLA